MLTTTGSPVKCAQDILALLDAVLLPKQVSVVYCPDHQKGDNEVAKGNRAADEATMRKLLVGPLL
jgi:hypothetical protein